MQFRVTDPRAALRAAFLLGEHVAEAANGIGVGTTPADKVISLLIGIASGKETLVPSGAELRAKAPDTPGLESIRDANQKAEHVAAHLILESLTPAN